MEAYTAIMMTVGAVILISLVALMVLLRTMARDRAELARIEGEVQQQPTAPIEYRAEELTRAPIGTLAILLVYLMVILGLWASVYLILLQRG
jgi:hypothetical protein